MSWVVGLPDGRPSNRNPAVMFQYGAKSLSICRLIARIAVCTVSSVIVPWVWLTMDMIMRAAPF